ncbi:MAG: hypothetical protein H7A39_06995 [Chlamydiales bacterium]|nr:hypothetical protein [Chlamydiales bacterium]
MSFCTKVKAKTEFTQYALMGIGAAAVTTKASAMAYALFQNVSLFRNPRALVNVSPFGKHTGAFVAGGLLLSGLVLGGGLIADGYRAWKSSRADDRVHTTRTPAQVTTDEE